MRAPSLSRNARRAIGKYGAEVCREAFRQHDTHGNGANTVSWTVAGLPRGNTNAADAAINAGRELARLSEGAQ